ncbi:MAG TPA: hypothetical protein VMU92_10490 [Acidobacteriaceae bacterium]|nr:hypothetical protein [Acidobacteriaceae bacterium]
MRFWIYLFASPIAFLAAILVYLLLCERSEFRRISAWAALLSGIAASGFALWGSIQRSAIHLPLAFQAGFDKEAWFVAIAAALFGLAWLLRSRRWYSFTVFSLSFLIAAFWTVVVLPLK